MPNMTCVFGLRVLYGNALRFSGTYHFFQVDSFSERFCSCVQKFSEQFGDNIEHALYGVASFKSVFYLK